MKLVAHIHIVQRLGRLFSLLLIAGSIWGMWFQSKSWHEAISWLVPMGFGLIVVGFTFSLGHKRWLTNLLLGFSSLPFFFYSLAWLLMGGVEDAHGYWPFLLIGNIYFAYAYYAVWWKS